MGFRFQIAADYLPRRMGYRILKAQQDPDLRRAAKSFTEIVNFVTVGDYLWDYAD